MVPYSLEHRIYIFVADTIPTVYHLLWFIMVALCNRADHYIFILFLLLLLHLLLLSSIFFLA